MSSIATVSTLPETARHIRFASEIPSADAGGRERQDSYDAGEGIAPFTARRPVDVTARDIDKQDAVNVKDLAHFVSTIKPRTVLDLKPLLLLCQGVLSRVRLLS